MMYRMVSYFIIWTAFLVSGCSSNRISEMSETPTYNAVKRTIEVDADISDWDGIKRNRVKGSDNLWIGHNLTPNHWDGNHDLSFSWRSAWYADRVFFLIEVKDESLPEPRGQYSWENDCIELLIDPDNQGGRRISGEIDNVPLEELLTNRLGKPIRGYEMHFLPTTFPVKAYVDDTLTTYHIENNQNTPFAERWNGQAKSAKTSDGYLIEIGFSIPGFAPQPGSEIGLEVGISDDDGNGRENLMIWTGKQASFWIDMDEYGTVIFVEHVPER